MPISYARRLLRPLKKRALSGSLSSSSDWVHNTIDEAELKRLCKAYYGSSDLSGIGVILDVGANIGQSCDRFRRLFPRAQIYAFEPTGAAFEQLRARFASDAQIAPMRLAMSDKDSEVRIFHSEHSMCNSLDAPWKGLGSSESVTSRRLDNLCLEMGLAKIHLLKIDTEGHDLQVLKGAESILARKVVDIVMVECGFHPGDTCHANFYEIANYLKPFGFHLAGFTETQNHDRIEGVFSLLYCNAIFSRSDLQSDERSHGLALSGSRVLETAGFNTRAS